MPNEEDAILNQLNHLSPEEQVDLLVGVMIKTIDSKLTDRDYILAMRQLKMYVGQTIENAITFTMIGNNQ